MNRHHLLALVVVAAMSGACGGSESDSSDSQPTASRKLEFRGSYVANSDESALTLISFVDDTRYTALSRGCVAKSCVEKGTYALDRSYRTLTLKSSATGKEITVPIEVLATQSASTTTPRSLGVRNLVDSDSKLVSGGDGKLVNEGESLVEKVDRFKLLDGSYDVADADKGEADCQRWLAGLGHGGKDISGCIKA